MSKKNWIISILLIFIISFSIYIYGSRDYLIEHSVNLQTGKGVESCRKVNAGFLVSIPTYVCDTGYYKVTYPTHQRIFYFSHSSNQVTSVSVNIKFLDNVDINTFQSLNSIYGADKNSLYHWGEKKEIQEINIDKLEILPENKEYIKDDKYIYFRDKKLTDAISTNYRFLNYHSYNTGYPLAYYRENNIQSVPEILISNENIYYQGEKLPVTRKGKFIINSSLKNNILNCKKIEKRSDDSNYDCYITETGDDVNIKPDLDSLKIAEDSVEQLTSGYFYLKDMNNVYILFAGKLIVVDGLKPKEFTYSYNEAISSNNGAGCNYSFSEYFNNEINKNLIFNEREFEGLCRYIGREK